MTSDLEHSLYFELRRNGLKGWVAEHRFKGMNGKRRYRFDVAWPEKKIAIDVQGGLYLKGRRAHGSPEQMKRDSMKQAEANLCGWIFIAVTPEMMKDGSAVELVKKALERVA